MINEIVSSKNRGRNRNGFKLVSRFIALTCLSLMCISCSYERKISFPKVELTPFEQRLAQKIMIDIRYFCGNKFASQTPCKQPVTRLPVPLLKLLSDVHIGGVVLFGSNIVSPQQLVELTNNLQEAATQRENTTPLLIAVDQEGGRVVRLPRESATSFAGNMAIGATYDQHGTYYATEVGKIIGHELSSVGINVNFSPDVDVNVNPKNPVINVRSFGKEPNRVAELGIAMMNGLQSKNVTATLKHFPGHGNTDVDSHTGLPVVNYDTKTITNVDLVPFKKAIELGEPGMIMTAHIQYPYLDPTKVKTNSESDIIRPATMSKKILTGILRDKLHYKGVVITDALDMDSIAANFSPETAVFEAFSAGADIALMPMKISTEGDIYRFKLFVKKLAKKIVDDGQYLDEIIQSNERINRLKKSYGLLSKNYFGNGQDENNMPALLSTKASRKIEKKLAEDAVTIIQNKNNILPISSDTNYRMKIFIENDEQKKIFSSALHRNWSINNHSKLTTQFVKLGEYQFSSRSEAKETENDDVIIILYSGGKSSAAEANSVQQWKINQGSKGPFSERQIVKKILSDANNSGTKVVLAGMRSPYELTEFLASAEGVVVAYDSTTYVNATTGETIGVTYDAVASLILGNSFSGAVLPVSLLSMTLP
jgi:beta-N-acetylhexosaminidase